ncbi:MAG: 7-cyano-7-deazaguanine synthase QueC [Candidatus Hydrogenedentes bacterium]|nr:7-cyano-7-deazaguanine synthase QueC [Candidatus Hydrogenedentota bacterium]
MSETAQSAVVLLSGGLDSTVLLHHVVRTLGRAPVHALSYRYGQRHSRELECAAWQTKAAGVAHCIIDLSFLGELLKGGSALLPGATAVPDLKDLAEAQLDQPPTYVPHRNMMLLSIACAYAEAHASRDVFYGAQALDEYGYWDCTAEFVGRLNRVLSLNRREAVIVHAPFVKLKKAETLALGLRLGVDFSHTWSCYRGEDVACGACPTCVERLNAFRAADATDPIPYRVPSEK